MQTIFTLHRFAKIDTGCMMKKYIFHSLIFPAYKVTYVDQIKMERFIKCSHGKIYKVVKIVHILRAKNVTNLVI